LACEDLKGHRTVAQLSGDDPPNLRGKLVCDGNLLHLFNVTAKKRRETRVLGLDRLFDLGGFQHQSVGRLFEQQRRPENRFERLPTWRGCSKCTSNGAHDLPMQYGPSRKLQPD